MTFFMKDKYYISFLVDADSKFYYQSELLLYSLINFAKVEKDQIIIQCTTSVSIEYISFLKSLGYNYTFVIPFLDGKYCNKITQLKYFIQNEILCKGVIFLDTDVFFLNSLNFKKFKIFSAKIVDQPNPPIDILKNIFQKKNIPFPVTISVDDKGSNQITFSTNFNGGFYYIPKEQLSQISEKWSNMASWLYLNKNEFLPLKYQMHIDQISMSLAISELKINYNILSANYNYPIHTNSEFNSYDQNAPICVIHYHNMLDGFGLIGNKNIHDQYLIKKIKKANSRILCGLKTKFLIDYKKCINVNFKATDQSKYLYNELSLLNNSLKKKIKIILHCGTPKTGTTTLQFFLYKNVEELFNSGCIYAPVKIDADYAPKHQWFINSLILNKPDLLINNLKEVLECLNDNIHTIIISTEGIFNHWFDIKPEGLELLRTLNLFFEVQTITFFRDPQEFAKSLYVQYLKNRRMPGNECYGRSMSIKKMLGIQWFNKHLDYISYIENQIEIFGEKNVKVFKYKKAETVDVFCKMLSIHCALKNVKNENLSLKGDYYYILRIINIINFRPKVKNKLIELLEKYNRTIYYKKKNVLKRKNKKIVLSFFRHQIEELKRYQLDFDDI